MTRSPADDHNNLRQPRTIVLATDNKNSVLAEIAGDKPTSIAYSAYGQQSAQQAVTTGLGFNGELREARIGWYLLGNGYRAYNPILMRFHSPDNLSPFGKGGLNAYMYCVGDPVNFSDPTGHMFKSLTKIKSVFKKTGTSGSTESLIARAGSETAGSAKKNNKIAPPAPTTPPSRKTSMLDEMDNQLSTEQRRYVDAPRTDPVTGESIYQFEPDERLKITPRSIAEPNVHAPQLFNGGQVTIGNPPSIVFPTASETVVTIRRSHQKHLLEVSIRSQETRKL
jgi:RHS repeat-associated protein